MPKPAQKKRAAQHIAPESPPFVAEPPVAEPISPAATLPSESAQMPAPVVAETPTDVLPSPVEEPVG
jgi:hypothetical protein